MRMWRTMFSISTMASSTRMPVTSVMPSRLTRLSEKPISSIAQKVGMADSGSAMAVISVARQLRRKMNTTSTASDGALDQRLHRRLVVAARVGDGVVDLGRGGRPGTACRSSAMLGVDDVGDRQLARALGAEDGEGDDRLAVEAGEGARLARRRRSPGRARRGAPCGRRAAAILVSASSSTRARAGQRADRLLLAADLAAAAGEIDVGGAELAVDVGRRDAERQQPVGIERDADLAVDAAVALDAADALQALQLRA